MNSDINITIKLSLLYINIYVVYYYYAGDFFVVFAKNQMLTRPSAANKSFPYHVRTTQVGAHSNETFANEQMDHFDAHCYAPTYVDGNGRTVDIFTVTGVLQVLLQFHFKKRITIFTFLYIFHIFLK